MGWSDSILGVRLLQTDVTTEMCKLALRANHIYNVKRDGSAKVRVVVNGKRQHESTFSDTTGIQNESSRINRIDLYTTDHAISVNAKQQEKI